MTENILLAQFYSTPPLTRYISLCIAVITILVYIKAVSTYSLLYSPLYLKNFEVWRILTCFLYFGRPSLEVFIHITFLYRYSRMLEEGFINTSDYCYLLCVVCSILFFLSNILKIPLLASAFSATITYIWTRKNPHAMVQIFGFISFPAFYLPFIVPMFMLLSESKILLEDVLGIMVGHVYFFFKDVYPKWGSDVLKTPCWIKKMFGEHKEDCCRSFRKVNIKKVNIKNSIGSQVDGQVSQVDGQKYAVVPPIGDDQNTAPKHAVAPPIGSQTGNQFVITEDEEDEDSKHK